jgi:hypothetical protein
MNYSEITQVDDSSKDFSFVTTANTRVQHISNSNTSYRGYYTLLFNLSSKMVRLNELITSMYLDTYGLKSLVKSSESIACFTYNLIKAVKLSHTDISFSSDRNVYNHTIVNGVKIYTGVGYQATMNLVSMFEDKGLLLCEKGYKFKTSKRSGYISLTQALVNMVEDNVDLEMINIKENKAVILVRDTEDKPLEFTSTKYTRGIIKVLTNYNKFMTKHEVTLDGVKLDAGLCRIFNNDFNHGGRLYTSGHSYQGVPSFKRKHILIDGEPTAEVDIKGSHIAMLHAMSNSYLLDGWDSYSIEMDGIAEYDQKTLSYLLCFHNNKYNPFRNLVKIALLIMVNADSQAKATYSLNEKIEKELLITQEKLEAMSQDELSLLNVCGLKNVNLKLLFKRLKVKHKAIQHHFFSGVGVELQKIEGDIFTRVADICVVKQYPVLIIHDSCRAKVTHITAIGEFITQAWCEYIGDTSNLKLEYEIN